MKFDTEIRSFQLNAKDLVSDFYKMGSPPSSFMPAGYLDVRANDNRLNRELLQIKLEWSHLIREGDKTQRIVSFCPNTQGSGLGLIDCQLSEMGTKLVTNSAIVLCLVLLLQVISHKQQYARRTIIHSFGKDLTNVAIEPAK